MTRVIRTTISRADKAASPYHYIPFDVPAGTTRIDVTLAYAKAEDCIIDLGAFDPRVTEYPSAEGFRGWSGGARDRFFIATDDATPGYVHGEIVPGRWQVVLGLYRVPVEGVETTVTVALDAAPRSLAPQPKRSRPVRAGAGWYRGDLHCHTFHSDAKGAPEVLHAQAVRAGLDFLAVADHNTITQRRYFHAASSPDLVFVRGMEVTTAEGHANVFGVDDWIDFRMTQPSDAHVLARLVHEKGGLLSLNHDKPPIPWDFELPDADCMEVWQSHWSAWNHVSLDRWQARLAEGRRLSAIGGSDYHQPAELRPEGPFVLGRPTTVLWLPELSEDAVLAAMKVGRGYVTEGPNGPHLDIGVGEVRMGGSVAAGPIAAGAHVRGAKGDRLVWIDATGPIGESPITSEDWRGGVDTSPRGFLRAEVVADAARERLIAEAEAQLAEKPREWIMNREALAGQQIRRALSNPIYVGGET